MTREDGATGRLYRSIFTIPESVLLPRSAADCAHEHCHVESAHHARVRLHLPGLGHDLPRHRGSHPDTATVYEWRRALPVRRRADVRVASAPRSRAAPRLAL